MHTHNGDPLSLFANLVPVHVHNLQTYDNLVSMHIIIYKEIKSFLFSSIFYLYTLLRQQLNIVKCIVQQLRISAPISAPISALHAVISHRQTGQIQR